MSMLDLASDVAQARDSREPAKRSSGGASSWIRLALVGVVIAFVGWRFGWPILAIIAALTVSILLHELGHYLVARWAGMKVTEFFIGFGRPLWSFQRGETTYGLKPLLFGAYVRIVGMSNLEQVDPDEEDRSYRSKPYWKRLAVVLAGPMANFAIALVLLVVLFAGFGQTRVDSWQVGRVVDGSAAAEVGLQPGDRLLEVAGSPISDWASFQAAVGEITGGPVEIAYERDGERYQVTANLGWRLDAAAAAALPPLQEGDQVVSVAGEPVGSYEAFASALEEQQDGTAEVVLRRALGDTMPTYRTNLVVPADLPEVGSAAFVGVGPSEVTTTERLGPIPAIGEAARSMVEVITETGRVAGSLLSPSGIANYFGTVFNATSDQAPAAWESQLQPVDPGTPPASSPTLPESANGDRPISILGIASIGAQAAEYHPSVFIWLLAVVNISLGLLNLLPLPPLDGGHAAVATYEAIRERISRRPYRVDMARLMPVTYVVIFVFVTFGLSAMYLDVVDPVQVDFGP